MESFRKQPRSGEMFIACRPSHFVLFRNERNAHFAHFGRALNQGRFSFHKHFVPTALFPTDSTSVSALSCCFEWKLDPKCSSLPRLALNFDVPAVQVEDLTDDRKA